MLADTETGRLLLRDGTQVAGRKILPFCSGVGFLVTGLVCLGLYVFAELSIAADARELVATGNAFQVPLRANPVAPQRPVNAAMAEDIAAKAMTVGLSMAMGLQPAQALEAAMAVDSIPAPVYVKETDATVAEPPTAPAVDANQPQDNSDAFADSIRARLPGAEKAKPQKITEQADTSFLYGMGGFFAIGLVGIGLGTTRFEKEQKDAESAWKAADKSSLYYRIGGDGLITPAGFVFEDYILANREARALFQGIPREEALSLQREFMVALLGGPTEATGLKALMVKKYADDPEYDAMLSCLAAAFQELEVPADLILECAEQAEIKRDVLLDRKPLAPKA
jgi:truncated hemoglobin YjbI